MPRVQPADVARWADAGADRTRQPGHVVFGSDGLGVGDVKSKLLARGDVA